MSERILIEDLQVGDVLVEGEAVWEVEPWGLRAAGGGARNLAWETIFLGGGLSADVRFYQPDPDPVPLVGSIVLAVVLVVFACFICYVFWMLAVDYVAPVP